MRLNHGRESHRILNTADSGWTFSNLGRVSRKSRNFSGPRSWFIFAMFAFKIKVSIMLEMRQWNYHLTKLDWLVCELGTVQLLAIQLVVILKFAFGPKKVTRPFKKRAHVQRNIRCLIANRNRTINGKEIFFKPFKANDILFSIVHLCVKSVTGVIIWKMQTLFADFPIQYKNKINDSHVRNNNNFSVTWISSLPNRRFLWGETKLLRWWLMGFKWRKIKKSRCHTPEFLTPYFN